ncbi:4'-phosphopantetheinyl transferase superfamily protein [Mesorhizobium sp. CC13]|uniref:4'-phosphopantetheinyl transferase family protein n=1 Tax=Mesorhizobium sp. CC13 TaxID=3029194 RepID=UPI0032644893
MSVALARLFEPDVAVAQGDPRGDWGAPLPGEEEAIARASAARRREFMAGRALARTAMRELGLAPAAVPAGGDRAPAWPAGTTGSISHCADWCVAAVARSADGYLSVGLDIEPALPLDAGLVEEICTADERAWLAAQPAGRRGLLARAVFSAKECAYKCQYPLSGKLFGFDAMSVRLDLASGTFVARFEADAGPFSRGEQLAGRMAIGRDHVVTAMTLKHAGGCRQGAAGLAAQHA